MIESRLSPELCECFAPVAEKLEDIVARVMRDPYKTRTEEDLAKVVVVLVRLLKGESIKHAFVNAQWWPVDIVIPIREACEKLDTKQTPAQLAETFVAKIGEQK